MTELDPDKSAAAFWDAEPVPQPHDRRYDNAKIISLAESGATQEEIAAFFGMDDAEWSQLLADTPALAKAVTLAPKAGKAALKRRQYQMAVRGDTPMLKHLGEHVLGQKQKIEVEGEIKHYVIRAPQPCKSVAEWEEQQNK